MGVLQFIIEIVELLFDSSIDHIQIWVLQATGNQDNFIALLPGISWHKANIHMSKQRSNARKNVKHFPKRYHHVYQAYVCVCVSPLSVI